MADLVQTNWLSHTEASRYLRRVSAGLHNQRSADGNPVYYSRGIGFWIEYDDDGDMVALRFYRKCPCGGGGGSR